MQSKHPLHTPEVMDNRQETTSLLIAGQIITIHQLYRVGYHEQKDKGKTVTAGSVD
jgi:hypothetical protein